MRTGRHYGMDWLRIGAFGLLILYHIGMYFAPWGWHVKAGEPQRWVAIPMLATNCWRLALLFLVSGYASAALFAKLGHSSTFARSRSSRLLIPLIFAIIFVIPPQPWIDLKGQHGYPHDFLHFWLHDYFGFQFIDGIALPTWQHLWFVVYLWVYSMLAALMMAVIPAGARERMADRLAAALRGRRLLVAPICVWIAIDLAFPDHDDTHALFDDGPSHLHYLVAFAAGWLLCVRPVLFEAVARCWQVAAVLAVIAFLPIGWAHASASGESGAPYWATLIYHLSRQIHGWATIVALLGIADRFWNRDHPQRAMLAEAVFPFYIMHQTIIVAVGWFLLGANVAALPSFLILLTSTVAGCWLFYWIGSRIGGLRPMIGLRRQREMPR